MPPFFLVTLRGADDARALSVEALEKLEAHPEVEEGTERWFGFVDPSSLASNPGWPLRNLLFLLQRRLRIPTARVLCLRHLPSPGAAPPSPSPDIVLDISLSTDPAPEDAPLTVVGWEANARGKMGARQVDLAPFMDPKIRAVESADLNLKLMRWRFLPDLDTDRIRTTKCLLLGAGTLGCNVARSLTSWGARDITFVDYGRVSYSNPTRQWLFEFEDCVDPERPNEGRPKAQAAADRLNKIVPDMNARGISLSIPMPGHPVAPALQDKVLEDVKQLEELIIEADLIFLLTDTRESRWLPTLIAAANSKILMNVALGFDTFVIIRHGVPDPSLLPEGSEGPAPCNLGCYFCNDVVAPTDSTRNRTLDQQCTATRPGLSAIASSISVELAVTLLHHPQRALAPADLHKQLGEETESAGLGLLPHQIRGFLANFSNVLIVGSAFERCTACSPNVTGAYTRDGHAFLLKAFNQPDFLEEVSGLKDLLAAADDGMAGWEDDDMDDDDM